MNAFTRSISQLFKGAVKAFQTFPATIACALAFTIVTMIRIQLDWPQQEAYNFLFNCLHWTFAFGAIFSLAAITAAQSRFNTSKAFLIANLTGVAASVATFLLLYLPGGVPKAGDRFAVLSGLAMSRVGVAILVSFLAFIILAAYPKDQSDFSRSLFMAEKAFFIALIYGLVIEGGASGVAGAFRFLVYRQMSMKVFMYIATVVGFLAFTLFVGYFPDFRKGQIDEKREAAQKQPRFVEILFGYIMIPIVLALTAVLLLWTGKTLFTGMGASFVQLAGIATAYTVGGIWLWVMVTHYDTGLAKFYRRIYPVAALVILAFEAWAILNEVRKFGLKMPSYSFAIIWVIALAASVLLLILKDWAHLPIVALACALAVVSVLPGIGYHTLPLTSQINRLQNLLASQNMLDGDRLVPAATEPDLTVRESITDSVSYLATAENAKLPAWFDKQLNESGTFKTKLGFEQAWPSYENAMGETPGAYMGTSLYLPNGAFEIGGYRWAVKLQTFDANTKDEATATVKGDRGTYQLYWRSSEGTPGDVPVLRIELDGRVILKQDLNAYLSQVSATYPPSQRGSIPAAFDDMSMKLETPEISVLLVFGNMDINVDTRNDVINYFVNLRDLYMNEKP